MMRFLSVAERELRAGARQKATHRLRWITAAAFFGLLVWLMWAFSGFRAPQIFRIFSAITFFYCLMIGTARTADCLSSEKREGTMGLLFLTNLNGAEIIGGKLCSSALAGAYGLMAIFPLLAGQMLVGGITLGHFWRTILALAEAILFAVATGFLASSFCVRQFTAIASATGLALFFSTGMMAISAVISAFRTTKGSNTLVDAVSIFSPLYTFVSAEGLRVFRTNRYWWSVLAVTSLSLLFLTLATWRISRSWRDRASGVRTWSKFKLLERWRARSHVGGAVLRKRLLTTNPFFWLAGRCRVAAAGFMFLTIITVACTSYLAAPFFDRVMRAGTISPVIGHVFAWSWAAALLHGLVLYYAAMVSSRRLAEDKQTGALELVLSTPTSERSISRGLWMAYARRMLFPATIAILLYSFLIWQAATLAVLEPPGNKLPPGVTPGQLFWHSLLNRPLAGVQLEWGFTVAVRAILLGLLLLILIWFTLGWLGRWLGLRMRHPGFAPLLSIGLVFVPSIVLFTVACFCADLLKLDHLPDRVFVPMIVWVGFAIGAGQCLLLSFWAAGRLRRDFRTVVTSRFQPPPLRPWWRPARRTVLRYGLGALAVGASLVMITLGFYGYQNWRGRRAWSAFQAELKQRKESLEVAVLLPGPVPQSQNFALTPEFRSWVNSARSNSATKRLFEDLKPFETFRAYSANAVLGVEWTAQVFAPLDDYLSWIAPGLTFRSDASRAEVANSVLRGLNPYAATLGTLVAASSLPYFQTLTNCGTHTILYPTKTENGALERLHMILQIRACALLATNRAGEAGEDWLAGLHLVRLSQQLPDKQSSLMGQILLTRSLQPLWEGIIQQRWTDLQLASFQKELSQFNLLADHTNTVRRVVLATIEMWQAVANDRNARMPLPASGRYAHESVWQMQPRAWWLDNCIQLYRAAQLSFANVGAVDGRVNLDDWVDLEGLPLDHETVSLLQQFTGLAQPLIVVFAQTALNQAILACALERYRLAQDRYPETLDQLLPQYLPAIPNDVMRGKPMLYENNGDGHFVLRSVGPNQTDDRKNKSSDDWLWSFPTNAPAVLK